MVLIWVCKVVIVLVDVLKRLKFSIFICLVFDVNVVLRIEISEVLLVLDGLISVMCLFFVVFSEMLVSVV